ncbi:RHS repeat-associated core domain-containing protein [Echinicola vietnamensis]|uniref:RHS repeat-associated core domain protein n=1 Tax=Echinicola vietnamensis (strain DSM 17526 / LMG 23754 / KMM 6221) TaxID=926556 RepID=L0FY38_ECHVK|nr:RHS repeat-associated core domain-containing protein [Echinicola vietnamensis]AGA78212.1 RHS repeat-associated core domain protein [Echinicola vietnamensis DSM 17526]
MLLKNIRKTTGYKFNAKELDEEAGSYYYGMRYYDPQISMWLSVDRLAAKYPTWTPYNFTMNNPVNLIDPNGDSTVYFINYDLSPEDANTVMNHTRDINEKNGITGLDYKVISSDEAKDLKLIKTDAVISLRDNMSEYGDMGSTDPYVFMESQDYQSIKDTYVNQNSVDRNTGRANNEESRLYGYGYIAAHEIQHQYIAKASKHFWGNYNELPRHDNRTINLNHEGGMHVPKYSAPYLRAAEQMTPMHQNMIKHFLKQNGVR